MPEEAEFTEHGAATFVSGIGWQPGVTLGVALETTARLRRGDEGISVRSAGDEEVDSSLVRVCMDYAKGIGLLDGSVAVEVRSQIPPSRGMKSSSSVSLAVLGAAFRLAGRDFNDSALLRLSAELSVRAGVSITGAYDDAAACHLGGVIYASNGGMRIIRRTPVKAGYIVLFCIPARRITKSSLPVEQFSKHSREMRANYRAAFEGRLRDASMSNTALLCGLLDIDPAPSAEALAAGAVISGLTGTGPAFFAVCTPLARDDVASAFKPHGSVLATEPWGVTADGLAL